MGFVVACGRACAVHPVFGQRSFPLTRLRSAHVHVYPSAVSLGNPYVSVRIRFAFCEYPLCISVHSVRARAYPAYLVRIRVFGVSVAFRAYSVRTLRMIYVCFIGRIS